MKKTAYLFFASVLISATSCSKEVNSLDTQKPTVQIQSPTNHQEIPLQSVLQVKALLKDNAALASYKIEIHSAEDGHQHRPNSSTAAVDFHYEETFTVDTAVSELMVQQSINIPANAKEQHYHVGLFVLDKAGNQNQQFVEIFIGEEHSH